MTSPERVFLYRSFHELTAVLPHRGIDPNLLEFSGEPDHGRDPLCSRVDLFKMLTG